MKSKTKINKQTKKKTNKKLAQTIFLAKKQKGWLEVAGALAGPRRKMVNVNLSEINKESKQGEIIVVPGKVLSMGELDKKLKIVAMSFSERAKEKIKKSGGEFITISEEINKNPQAKNLKIIK